MSYKKRTSRILSKAKKRIAAVKTVSSNFQISQAITLSDFGEKVNKLTDQVDKYNGLLGEADELANQIDALELEVKDLNERLLLSVGSNYGKDSNEYEKAGGVRKSDRKKTVRKDKPMAA